MNIHAKIEKNCIVIDTETLFKSLDDESKKHLLELFTFEELIPAIEKQLKHNTDSWSSSTSGERDGCVLREKIMQIQGLEEEFRSDMSFKISNLESDRDNYKRYYEWYWKLFHFEDGSLMELVKRKIGEV